MDAFSTASVIAEQIRRRDLGCLEATDSFIDRIERLDGPVNAVVVRDFDRARDAARDADRASATMGPLHGVPMTVKEGYHVAGLPTTFGYPALADNTPDWDSACVARYKAAGAILLGKTNMAFFQQLFWSGLVTAPYLPSTVFPASVSNEGLPIGLQAVGSAYHDHVPIDFTRLLAKEIGGFRIPPGYE